MRKTMALLTAVALVISMTACAGNKPAATTAAPAAPAATQAASQAPAQTAAPAAPAEKVEEVKIGIIEPFTGGSAVQGETIRRAYEYAANQINEAGGIKSLGGAKLKLIFADHQGKNEVGMSEAERLITEEGVSIVVGACSSGVVMAATQVTERMQVPFIVDIPAGNSITERGFKYTFRTNIKSSMYGDTFAEFLKYMKESQGLECNTLATFFDDTEAGRSLVNDGMEGGAKQLGMEVVTSQAFPTNVQDTSTYWAKIKASNPDVIGTHISGAGTAVIATQQAADIGVTPKLIVNANGAIELTGWHDEVQDLAEGWCIMIQWNADVPGMAELAKVYKEATGAELDGFGAMGIQVIHVIRAALEKAASADPVVIRDALADLRIETGSEDLIMPWQFIDYDENGQNAGARNIVVQWQDGKRLTVYPVDAASAEVKAPFDYFKK